MADDQNQSITLQIQKLKKVYEELEANIFRISINIRDLIDNLFKNDFKWLECFPKATNYTFNVFSEFIDVLKPWKFSSTNERNSNDSMPNLIDFIKNIRIAILSEIILRPNDNIELAQAFARKYYEKYQNKSDFSFDNIVRITKNAYFKSKALDRNQFSISNVDLKNELLKDLSRCFGEGSHAFCSSFLDYSVNIDEDKYCKHEIDDIIYNIWGNKDDFLCGIRAQNDITTILKEYGNFPCEESKNSRIVKIYSGDVTFGETLLKEKVYIISKSIKLFDYVTEIPFPDALGIFTGLIYRKDNHDYIVDISEKGIIRQIVGSIPNQFIIKENSIFTLQN